MEKAKEIVVSGIRPTGNLHLGNYFGAVKGFLQMQHEYNCLFFVADWHSLTTHPRPANIQESVRTIFAEYLACGIDPEVATLYVQSSVPEITELYLYLNMNAGIGELMRTTSFKDKARQQLHIDRVHTTEGDVEREIFNEGNKHSVSAGLLTYPTLMAADIIIHKAVKVPVGKDQEQNMEMARRFARRFNQTYGVDFFPEPASFYYSNKAVKIPGLDGSGKMGKSEGNAIYLIDDEKTIRKKVMKAVTDSGPTEPNSPKPEPIANLFTMMDVVSSKETYDYFDEKYNTCEIRYGDMKKQLAEDINAFCAPIRERILDIRANTEYMEKVMREGAEKARESASKTLKEVRQIIGFRI
ncbi:tryptophan--tRNA ligase [Parabacteroides sp. An277]|uniref:tryptophan--tRNA ligase n=1 Tax=Parabacteroides sp. An277 TaxID=1965619 RepID=UPI000B369EB5|nr:tryptophan--tRNA ligase [Parabacteroides sp. An277]OUO50978.1 tryptophan--tRNA ligase [Parabacteroides sp. An277]